MREHNTHAETRQRRRPKPVWSKAVMFSILAPCPAALRRGAVITEAFPPARNIIYTHTRARNPPPRAAHCAACFHFTLSHSNVLFPGPTQCNIFPAVPRLRLSSRKSGDPPVPTLQTWLSHDTERSAWNCHSLICFSTACNPDDRVERVYGERRRI